MHTLNAPVVPIGSIAPVNGYNLQVGDEVEYLRETCYIIGIDENPRYVWVEKVFSPGVPTKAIANLCRPANGKE